MKHTFAVLAYKDSEFLDNCIISLKNQTIGGSQIKILTSTPSAFLTNIALKYDLPLLINDDRSGIASDWTSAYLSADTDYVTLAHQDDIYLPDYTEECFKNMEKLKNKSLLTFTYYKEILENGKPKRFNLNTFIKRILLLPFLFKNNIQSKFIKKFILLFGNPVPAPSIMYNKKLIGDLRFSSDFKCNMDWKMLIDLSARQEAFLFINKILILHRIHKDSQTYNLIAAKVRESEDLKIFRNLWPESIAKFLFNIYKLSLKSNIRVDK